MSQEQEANDNVVPMRSNDDQGEDDNDSLNTSGVYLQTPRTSPVKANRVRRIREVRERESVLLIKPTNESQSFIRRKEDGNIRRHRHHLLQTWLS